jgi:hypothetical protein
VKEERVVGLGVLYEPMHGAEDICFCRLAHGALLVVCEEHHVLSRVAKVLIQIRRHVPNVVDTAAQLPFLAEVVDPNQQGFSFARTVRVLEIISLWCSVPKRYGLTRWGRRGAVVAVVVRVLVYRRKT